MTLDTGFPPTTPDAPIAFEVRATLPGKHTPHRVTASFSISPYMLTHLSLDDWLTVKLQQAVAVVLDKYREAQAAE